MRRYIKIKVIKIQSDISPDSWYRPTPFGISIKKIWIGHEVCTSPTSYLNLAKMTLGQCHDTPTSYAMFKKQTLPIYLLKKI